MTATGAIAWRARSELPITWDALASATQYGDMSHEIRLNFVKLSLFGTIANQTLEASLYNEAELLLAGKSLALHTIGPGIDYWMDQAITFGAGARQASELVSYTDRARVLRERYVQLLKEIEDLKVLVGTIPGGVLSSGVKPTKRLSTPSVSGGGGFVTPDPFSFAHGLTTGVDFRAAGGTVTFP